MPKPKRTITQEEYDRLMTEMRRYLKPDSGLSRSKAILEARVFLQWFKKNG